MLIEKIKQYENIQIKRANFAIFLPYFSSSEILMANNSVFPLQINPHPQEFL
jgi:hypothetical protein